MSSDRNPEEKKERPKDASDSDEWWSYVHPMTGLEPPWPGVEQRKKEGAVPLGCGCDSSSVYDGLLARLNTRMSMEHFIRILRESEQGAMNALLDLIGAWTGGDPLVDGSRWRREKKTIGQKLIQFESIARLYRDVPQQTLYRAYGLRGSERRMLYSGGLTITPRPGDLLESWTTDETWAYEMALTYSDGIVIVKPTAALDVFLNISALPDDDHGNAEGEVLVRPKMMTVVPSEVIETDEE